MSAYTVTIGKLKQSMVLLDAIEEYDFSDTEIDILRSTRRLIQDNLDDHLIQDSLDEI